MQNMLQVTHVELESAASQSSYSRLTARVLQKALVALSSNYPSDNISLPDFIEWITVDYSDGVLDQNSKQPKGNLLLRPLVRLQSQLRLAIMQEKFWQLKENARSVIEESQRMNFTARLYKAIAECNMINENTMRAQLAIPTQAQQHHHQQNSKSKRLSKIVPVNFDELSNSMQTIISDDVYDNHHTQRGFHLRSSSFLAHVSNQKKKPVK